MPISSTTGIEYSVPINWIDGKTFWVSAFDTGNNATTPINSVTATINIPSDVSLNTPIINKTNSTLDLSWGKSTASLPIAGYKISKGIDFNTSTHINTINSLSQSIPLDWVGDKTFWVSAVDIRNNEGPGVSTGAITRTILSAPSIDIQLILAKAEISWTIPTGTLPVKEYELWAGSSTSNWGDLGNTKVATVSTTNYRLPADWIGDKKFYVIGIDTSGTYGAVGNRLFTIIKPNTPTINNTTSLVGGALLDQFSLTWESSVVSTGNLPVEYYKVGYETTELARLSSNNYLAKATWLGDRTFWVTAVDLNGNESEKANKTLNISSPIAPSIKSDVIDNNVLVYWVPPIATLPIATYELSKDSTFNKSSDLYIGEKSGGFTTVFETMAGLYTYYLRAKDSAGNYGAYAQTTVSVAQPPDYILNVIWDVDKSQGIMANGVLDPSSNSIILPIDSIETYNAHFATRSGYTTFNNPGSYLMPSLGTGSYTTQVFNYGTNLAATNISVVPTVDMQGTPTATCTIYTGTDGINWPNVYTNVWTTFASNFQYVKVVINVTSTGGDDLYIIRSIDIRLDSKSKVDGNSFKVYPSSAANYNQVGTLLEVTQTSHGRSAGEYVYITGIPSPNVYKIQSSANANTFIVTAPSATSSGACTLDSDGTPTLFATSFIDVTSLMVSAQGTTPLTALYNFVDTPNPTMFKALLFNSAGVRQSGTISWSAKGY